MITLSFLPPPKPSVTIHDCSNYLNFWQTLWIRFTGTIRGVGYGSLYGTDLKTELIVATLITGLFAVLILRRKWFRRPLTVLLIIAVYFLMIFVTNAITEPAQLLCI